MKHELFVISFDPDVRIEVPGFGTLKPISGSKHVTDSE